jgi:hypothetical protein
MECCCRFCLLHFEQSHCDQFFVKNVPDDPAARRALFDGVRSTHGTTESIELDHYINAAEFAEAAADKLPALMKRR